MNSVTEASQISDIFAYAPLLKAAMVYPILSQVPNKTPLSYIDIVNIAQQIFSQNV